MKKIFIISAIALFGLTAVNAQEVEFGIKGGINLATITGDDFVNFDNRTCFHFGAVVEIGISENFSFQPELLYSCQGSDYGVDDTSFVDTKAALFNGTIKVDYLNVPLMAKYYVSEGLSLEAGPQLGFLISATDEFEGEEEDIKDFVKGIDFGVNFGLGYKLDGGLNFGARYNLGLSNANDDEDLSDITFKNGVFQFSLGYFF